MMMMMMIITTSTTSDLKVCKLFFHPFQQHFLLWCFFWGHTTTDDAIKQTISAAQFMPLLPLALRQRQNR
jgi:membrane-associated PAP2 superfamily phosphatase